ncbi:MAG TPA: TlpA disulfide reductase family protein [Candidatus Sulfomarinibacteraceae bacterium]|nr:TlpA disulfide reductase family protein [Candidatus Sulfomarinibacteraceae bacterium]
MSEIAPTSQVPAASTDVDAARPSIRWGRILIWVGIVALLALLGWGLLQANATRPEAGAGAPDFEMQYFQGYEWRDMPAASLDDMKGNVVVLNFWASWCVECRLEADLLENAWRQYGDQGVIFLGVAYVDSEAKSLAYLDEFDITYPNAPDLGSAISKRYEITGVPETFFIDRNGTVSRVVIGPVNSTTLHGEIAQLLAQ